MTFLGFASQVRRCGCGKVVVVGEGGFGQVRGRGAVLKWAEASC